VRRHHSADLPGDKVTTLWRDSRRWPARRLARFGWVVKLSDVGKKPTQLSVGCFMVVTRVFSVFVLAISMLSFAAKAQAADTPLTELDPEIAKRFGEMIHTQFAKENKDAKPKFEVNFEKASGLFNAESNEGIIVVPAKNFKEDRENKEVEKDPGVGVCFLCMSQTYNPLIDGKPVDGKKAFQIKFDDGQGGAERVATCLLCTIRHLEGDDWELYVWGKDKDPIIKTNWGEASNAPKPDLALTIEDPKKDSATLVFNIVGKYSASIPIAPQGTDAAKDTKDAKDTKADSKK
jgi:hypothetical protein